MEPHRERALREALEKAWTDYKNARPEDEKKALERYSAMLDEFANLVMSSSTVYDLVA